jgi:2-oxoisovalerate dehydrogenase E1 component beta subunit
MMTHIPGWKIVFPSNPLDAYGLMISACQELNPVMYLEPKALLRVKGEERLPGEPEDERMLSKMIDAPLGDRSKWKPQWPQLEPYAVPIGKGKVVRAGSQVTVVSYGRTLPLCRKAADELAQEGVDAEVIDLRSLWPYDWELLAASIKKTGRVLYVNEDTEVTNFGEHLVRRTAEELFYELLAPPRLLAGKFVPGIGLADTLEMASVPQLGDITAAIRSLAAEQP